ncbi:MAG: DUF6273 domain-containing protein [Lachnospiraceae bacterium]|nr:DUF6273 domain-containing protein [Lachnospiraceae bacterium]
MAGLHFWKSCKKRLLPGALSLMLVGSIVMLFPQTAIIVRAYDDKTITGLGTGVIAGPTNGNTNGLTGWTGNYVYYGTYNGNPVKYRVLAPSTSHFGGKTLFLDCDNILTKMKHDSITPYEYGANGWANSEVNAWLNGTKAGDFYHDSFTVQEKKAIAASVKSNKSPSDGISRDIYDFQPLTGERVFLLDAKEATNSSYGYKNDIQTSITRKKEGASTWWWLRSPDNSSGEQSASSYPEGVIYSHEVDAKNGAVSPALNINLSSVIFSSAIPGEPGSFKLTIADDNLNIFPGIISRDGSTITVPYTITGTDSSNATRVSVLITDRAYSAGTNITNGYTYMKLDVNGFKTTGTGTFTIPAAYTDKSYYVYILAEDENAGKATDYASSPVLILHNIRNVPSCGEYDDLYSALDAAIKRGGAQTIIWNKGNKLPYSVMKILQDNPDITLEFNYTYQDVDYRVTIPGKDVKADVSIPFYGPLYLHAYYGINK